VSSGSLDQAGSDKRHCSSIEPASVHANDHTSIFFKV
jgi:hypothetical protein